VKHTLVALCAWLVFSAGTFAAEAPQQDGPLGIKPTAPEIELGRKLFFDPRLSEDGTVSCATCHDPAKGWSDGQPLAIGIRGQVGTRHTPTIIGSSFVPLVFWDGRTVGTSAQALLPLSNPIEMGRQSEADVLRKLRLIPGYVSLFADIYGIDPRTQSPITGARLGRAIAAFETTVVSFDAPIDKFLEGDKEALSPDAQVGLKIFETSGCTACHEPPHYTDQLFHNNGMEFAGKLRVTDQGRAGILPAALRTPGTIRAFKTPTLREISRTAPYNHAGNFPDLERVVRHYATGGSNYLGQRDRFQDPRVTAIRLTQTQEQYLVLFLKEAFAGSSYPMISEPKLP
jgi:cytochrome c peroxidase